MSKIDYAMGSARGTVTVPAEQVGSMSVALQLNGAVIVGVRHEDNK